MPDDPDTLVDLTRTTNEIQAVSLIAELEAHGIPARAFSLGIMQYQMPMLQPQRVMVRRGDLDKAREILAVFQYTAGVDVDWAEVDTGDRAPETPEEAAKPPEQFVCARCGHSRAGLPPTAHCPECNAPPAQRYELPAHPATPLAQHILWLIIAVLIAVIAIRIVLGIIL